MKQLVQSPKSGKIEIVELPYPSVGQKHVLVKNSFSLISAGTGSKTIKFGKSSLIKKALSRPDLVNQVLQNFANEGLEQTYKKVLNRLDNYSTLGYSSSGIVELSFDDNSEFQKGDRVACAGQNYASHSEFVSVPQNLVVRIPDKVSDKEAAFCTIGSIALQGVRQADPKIGEYVCVIGAGLLGQITCQILKANGCKVLAIDIDDEMIKIVNDNKFAYAIHSENSQLDQICDSFTNGYGFDKSIITAQTNSNEPIELSSKILRHKGKIIVVGEVDMSIDREPYFYKKELELKISCSYGPGRYDSKYEEDGIDYPYGYVRWTEKRNMQAFLQLVEQDLINLAPLITHIFNFSQAVEAYDLISSKLERYIGILLQYDHESKKESIIAKEPIKLKDLNVGFIGAGNYAQSNLIPYVKKIASLNTVVTKSSINSLSVADKFSFNSFSTNTEDIFSNDDINTVFIATRHDTHAKYVLKAMEASKNIFVEKPLAINYSQLKKIINNYKKNNNSLMVGYNRRFSDSALKVKKYFSEINEPIVMNFRINAGFISKDHWIQSKQQGGRIVGEICHFVDLMQYFCNSKPTKVFAQNISSKNSKVIDEDNIAITLKFQNGSLGVINYISNGNEKLPKERIEISANNISAIINDFKSVDIYKNQEKISPKISRGKGQKNCVEQYLLHLQNKCEIPISFESLILTSLTCLKIIDSLKTEQFQSIEY